MSRCAGANSSPNFRCMGRARIWVENWHREQIDRLFRLDHASKLERMQAAFRALGAEFDFIIRSNQANPQAL